MPTTKPLSLLRFVLRFGLFLLVHFRRLDLQQRTHSLVSRQWIHGHGLFIGDLKLVLFVVFCVWHIASFQLGCQFVPALCTPIPKVGSYTRIIHTDVLDVHHLQQMQHLATL